MDNRFWLDKWQRNDIGFHQGEANHLLVAYFGQLPLCAGGTLFLPLCGKTRDIAWLLSRGVQVLGSELSELAVTQLFAELGAVPEIHQQGAHRVYKVPGLTVYQGDFFALDANELGDVGAVYDRAALVALPEKLRERYTQKLMNLTKGAPQLLVTFEYDQTRIDGPPFSIPTAEVQKHYQSHYRLSQLQVCGIAGGLKGEVPASESIWLLARE